MKVAGKTDPYEKFSLAGKSAFVTGGGSGLGYFMARGLARSGAKVMIAGRRENVLKAAADKITEDANGNRVRYCTVDLADRKAVVEVADHVCSELNGVDVFIGNAANLQNCKIDEISLDLMDDVFEVNVAANIALVKSFLPGMRARKWGRVIFSSSITSIRASALEGMAVYSASKNALNAFTRYSASEAGHDNITFNSLNLGVFETDMLQSIREDIEESLGKGSGADFIKQIAADSALGRLGRSEEVEGLVQLIASDAGSYITGSNIVIDGGMSIMLKANMPDN